MRKNTARQNKRALELQLLRELHEHYDNSYDWDMFEDYGDPMEGLSFLYQSPQSSTYVLHEGVAVTVHYDEHGTQAATCEPAAEWFARPDNPLRKLQESLRKQPTTRQAQ